MNRRRLCQLTAAILTSDLTTQVGFMKRHGDYHVTIQRRIDPIRWTRDDDVMGNLTVSKLRASQVTVGMLAYRCCDDS